MLTSILASIRAAERVRIFAAGLRVVVLNEIVEIQQLPVDADVTHASSEVAVLHLEVGGQLWHSSHLEGTRQVEQTTACYCRIAGAPVKKTCWLSSVWECDFSFDGQRRLTRVRGVLWP